MISREFDCINIQNIKIKHKSCDIDVVITDNENDNIKILYEGNNEPDFNKTGNTFYIEAKGAKSFFISFFNSSDHLEIKIPKNRNLFINILSGDISIHGLNNNNKSPISQNIKKLEVKTTAGDIDFANIYGTNSFSSTISGDIDSKNCYFKNVYIKGISSDIDLDNFGCETMEITTISGDIDVILNTPYKNIAIDSKSGDIDLIQPLKEINYKLKTFSGDLDSSKIIYSENAPILNISTLSGDIDIGISKYTQSEIIIDKIQNENEKYNNESFKNKDKIDEKHRILDMLLNNKISEKDAKKLLQSLGYSEEEIHDIFEEYLFIKMENNNLNNSDNGNNIKYSNNNNDNDNNNNDNNNNNFNNDEKDINKNVDNKNKEDIESNKDSTKKNENIKNNNNEIEQDNNDNNNDDSEKVSDVNNKNFFYKFNKSLNSKDMEKIISKTVKKSLKETEKNTKFKKN